MPSLETNRDPAAVALQALVWTLSDSGRAERLLTLTGIGPDDLRERIGDPTLLAATLAFLEAHEPDLLACAAALDLEPLALVRARMEMEA